MEEKLKKLYRMQHRMSVTLRDRGQREKILKCLETQKQRDCDKDNI